MSVIAINKIIPTNCNSNFKSVDSMKMDIFDSIHRNSKIVYYDATMMRISIFLNRAGIKPSMKGFKYIRMAIKMAIEDENSLDAITKDIYPVIAKRYGTNWSAVERSMRTVIGKAENGDFINEIFYGQKHFTNKDFIAMASEYISTIMK